MRKNLIQFLLVAVLSLCSTWAFAQSTVTGQLVDSETGEPLVGAAVVVEGTTQGTVTDVDGNFSLRMNRQGTLLFKYVGYKDLTLDVVFKGASTFLGTVEMEPDAVILSDVTITSTIAVSRKTPIAVSTVDPVFIEDKLGTQEFPEILKSTPGVYVTKDGGGFGDAQTRIRGFESDNVAMMINGVPMNGMENNLVYWSNWSGLSDVTRSMQVQRGLGAAKVASPAVGGSINIITKGAEAQKGGFVSYTMGNDGYNKILFSVSSGLSKDGWAFTLLGGRTWGDGYIQGTEFEGYNWFASITKRFNDNHQLSLTAFGAPQWHNQRNSQNGLTIKEWQRVKKYMGEDSPYKYNPTFGYDKNGQMRNSSRNAYHKPQISLNHLWQIDHKSSLSTALYVSIGRGNGYSGNGDSDHRSLWYGATNGLVNNTFRHEDGTFAYDEVQELNEQSTTGSKMIMAKSMNNHMWYGLLSTYTTKFGEYFDFYGGIDLRYYKGLHQNIITDLYNGAYFVDPNRENIIVANKPIANDPNYVNEKLGVGDVIYRNYDGFVMTEGVFAQLEYNQDKLSAFVAGGASNTSYWRYDRFYYDEAHAKSGKKHYFGGNIKGGLNYNITDNHNVFFNAGYVSRAPMFDTSFINSQNSHARNPDAKNEKIMSFELGYGFRSSWLSANLNLYYTKWMDKAMYDSGDYSRTNEQGERVSDTWRVNMTGADAKHMGVELDLEAKITRWLDVTGMFSYGDWRWDGVASGFYTNSEGQIMTDFNGGVMTGDMSNAAQYRGMVRMDNIHVGGSAQTTAALGVNVRPLKGLRLSLDWNFFGRNYAGYDLDAGQTSIGEEAVVTEPWEIPSYNTFDLSAGYTFDFGKTKATLSGNIFNLLDQEYIADARDGANHDWESATRVFYGFGRTYNVRLKFTF